MSDPSLPLTEHEHDEFGNPEKKDEFTSLRQICPYHGLLCNDNDDNDSNTGMEQRKYPSILICCSEDDQRVPLWGILKYAAKLRSASSISIDSIEIGDLKKDSLVIVSPDITYSGHLPNDAERVSTKALQYAFLLQMMK